jgi:K(+)-stimulated pyrophosphate-energized sodium pump
LVGLVIAPILGSGHGDEQENDSCLGKQKCEVKANCDWSKCQDTKAMTCDLSKCAKMTKEECAKMCDEKGCSPEEKAMCLSNFDKDGKWIGDHEKERSKNKECCKKK